MKQRGIGWGLCTEKGSGGMEGMAVVLDKDKNALTSKSGKVEREGDSGIYGPGSRKYDVLSDSENSTTAALRRELEEFCKNANLKELAKL